MLDLMQSSNITLLGDDIQVGLMGSFSRGVENPQSCGDIKKTRELLDMLKPRFEKLTNEKLFELRIALDKEMLSRGLKFSVGEIGETIVVNYFNSTPGFPNLMAAPTGAKNVDALSRDGDRYSIKTVQKAKKTGTIYPDSKNKDKQLFEYLWFLYRICG